MTDKDLTQIMARLEKLETVVFGAGKSMKAEKKRESAPSGDLDFSLNERAFVKRYRTNKSGPKKFTLLLAYLAKGQVDKNIGLSEIKKRWDKMKGRSLLGAFNMFYPIEAKTQGWVNSKERGAYSLSKQWKEATSE